MTQKPIAIALVGIGEIARNQHIPSITRSNDFSLKAAASRNGIVDDIDNFKSIDELVQ